MNYTGDLFIEIKACVGSATLLGWVDNRRMILLCATNSSNTPQGFEFRVFPSRLVALPRLKSLICPTILPIGRGRRDDYIPICHHCIIPIWWYSSLSNEYNNISLFSITSLILIAWPFEDTLGQASFGSRFFFLIFIIDIFHFFVLKDIKKRSK